MRVYKLPPCATQSTRAYCVPKTLLSGLHTLLNYGPLSMRLVKNLQGITVKDLQGIIRDCSMARVPSHRPVCLYWHPSALCRLLQMPLVWTRHDAAVNSACNPSMLHVLCCLLAGAAVTDARHNASVNGVCNASFACVDLAAGVPDPAEWAGIEAGIEHGAVGSVSAEGKVVQGSQGGGRSMACTDPAGAAGLQAPMDAEGRALDNMGVSVSPGGYSTAGSGLGGAARAAWLAPDVIVCDPARAGLSAAVVAYIRASTARR